MRKTSVIPAFIALVLLSANAKAQTATIQAATPSDSVARVIVAQPAVDESLANLQKAAEDLSKAVEVAATKIVNNPELKVAALQVAAGAVGLAQQSLAQQLKTIEAALNAAARQIAVAQSSIAKKQE